MIDANRIIETELNGRQATNLSSTELRGLAETISSQKDLAV